MKQRFHCLRHVNFEGLSAIQRWLDQQGYPIQTTNVRNGDTLPPVDDFDALIILGGPQSARQLDQHPYLYQEIEFIQSVLATNKPMLGICLGAQLIAHALGAPAEKSPEPEIGFFDCELTEAGKQDPVLGPLGTPFLVQHYHADMPGLNQQMELLATSQGCPRQAFKYGDQVYGFQFHLEIDRNQAERMIEHAGDDLTQQRPFIQSAAQLLAGDFEQVNQRLFTVLDRLFKR